ncbi:MAG: TonB-dependent receptor [Gammaproteobacteria bacterium]|nr:TonB-dependent receptor [Gammaproteobacteria bacterium]
MKAISTRFRRCLSWMFALGALFSAPLAAQQGTLSGRVTDAEAGTPVSGATIEIVGQMLGATGAEGDFSASVPAGTHSVIVTLIGYETTRLDGIAVDAGGTTEIEIPIRSRALILNPVVVTASRRQEKALEAPASVSSVSSSEIQRTIATTAADHVQTQPGLDIFQAGLTSKSVVSRGFNNVFSGTLLTIVDNRYARIPYQRFNAFDLISATDLDIDRIEVSLGPGSALYGPNAAAGVMHIITASPIDRPGTTVSLAAGERSIFTGQFRTAVAPSERFGFKLSGQYMRGNDFEYRDPVEVGAAAVPGANPRIAARDFFYERYSFDARADIRGEGGGAFVLNGGMSQMNNAIVLTGIGAAQGKNWVYPYVQARFSKDRFFAQAFYNTSNAGDTYLLRTGQDIVDQSYIMSAQIQHGFDVGERQSFTYGVDLIGTNPRTEGTVLGRNEDDDDSREVGAYLHSETALSDMFDLVAAVRVDDHSRLTTTSISPRVALVLTPTEGQNIRFTYNRAFSTPSTNNLFLDILAANIPILPGISYGIRSQGVPLGGYTFGGQCQGGVESRCMYSPLMPGQALPANAAVFWNPVIETLLPQFASQLPPALVPLLPTLGAMLLNPGAGDPQLGTLFRRFDVAAAGAGSTDPFVTLAGPGVLDVPDLVPTIHNSFEVGYKGLINDRVLLAADVYRTRIENFVGSLRVETPNVFFDPASVQAFVLHRLDPLIRAGLIPPALIEGPLAVAVGAIASLPLGTLAADQSASHDLLLTYRNFGDVWYSGADLALEVLLSDQLSLNGNFSWKSAECFNSTDDDCNDIEDVALNAPSHNGSLGFTYANQGSGFSAQGRVRMTAGFPINSGTYIGVIDGYQVMDASVSYRLPFQPGTTLSVTGNNLFDSNHTEFIGAAPLGRFVMFRVRHDF